MITRMWHGRTLKENASLYRNYVIRTGVRDYQKARGNLGVQIWQQDEGDVTHIWTVTVWKDLDAIRSFAGNDVEKAKYYPEDRRFLLELEPRVMHFRSDAFPADPPAPSPWRITM